MSKDDKLEQNVDENMPDEVKNPKSNPKARRYGKAGTFFDIKAFKKQLDECNFPKLSFSLEKRRNNHYYIVVMSYDPDTGVGVLNMRTKHGPNRNLALNDLQDIMMRYVTQLPQREKNKHFLP